MKNTGQQAQFQRAALLLGRAAMDRMARSRVVIFGLGGVGSWCAEGLVRTGVGHLTLVDSDVICVTNVNRQAQATAFNVGAVKADELRSRLREIHPEAEIEAVRMAYNETTGGQFDLSSYDYVIDAIDSLKNKILLIENATASGATLYSSMGAAARLDPTQIRVGTLDQTRMCPLARAVRQGLRQRHVPLRSVRCVYSVEPPLAPAETSDCGVEACHCPPQEPGAETNYPDWCSLKARINGAVVQVTAAFGLTLASLVVNDIVSKTKSGAADITQRSRDL